METKADCGPENGCNGPKCPDCEKRAAEIARAEEINLAILIALVPAMTWSFFNMLGLF